MKKTAIKESNTELPLKTKCDLLNISKSTYYYKQKQKTEETTILKKIKEIILEFPGYGYRRVTKELERKGYRINHKRVLFIMKKHNLTKKKKKKFRSTTNSNHNFLIYPNLIKELSPKNINQIWVADITYIRLRYVFCYLSCIMDIFSKVVVGWSLKDNLSSDLSLAALRMALVRRDIKQGLIHHSDRGIQYAANEYVSLLRKEGIQISMSRAGNPYENAFAESFIATLKKEEVYLNEYDDIGDALFNIGHFIEDVYNRKRLHSSIGYLPPLEFEEVLNKSVT